MLAVVISRRSAITLLGSGSPAPSSTPAPGTRWRQRVTLRAAGSARRGTTSRCAPGSPQPRSRTGSRQETRCGIPDPPESEDRSCSRSYSNSYYLTSSEIAEHAAATSRLDTRRVIMEQPHPRYRWCSCSPASRSRRRSTPRPSSDCRTNSPTALVRSRGGRPHPGRPDALGRLARSLTGLGVVSDGRRRHLRADAARADAVTDAPGSMRDLALMWMETHYAPFAGLVDTVRTGDCAAETHYGRRSSSGSAASPSRRTVHRGDGQPDRGHQGGGGRPATTSVRCQAHRRPRRRRRHDAALVLASSPEAIGVSYDLPHVVPAVAVVAKAAGLEERLTGRGGDFFGGCPRASTRT